MPRARVVIAQPSRRVLAVKEAGRKGGLATAANHSAEWRTARSEKAGRAVVERYGRDYFKHIRSLRTKYPTGSTRPGRKKGSKNRPKVAA